MDFHYLDFVEAPGVPSPSKSGVKCVEAPGVPSPSKSGVKCLDFVGLKVFCCDVFVFVEAALVFSGHVPTKFEALTPPGGYSIWASRRHVFAHA